MSLPTYDFDPALKLDEQICFPVYALSRLITKVYQPLLAPLGLTYPQYLVMMLVWEHRELAVKTIGQELRLDTGTLTPLLKLLEQRGLVSRLRDPQDERSVLITLLPAGAALHEQARLVPKQLREDPTFATADVTGLSQQLRQLISLFPR